MGLRAWQKRIRDYNEITNVGPIVRRYFVIGAFDGALTILGFVVGAFAVGGADQETPHVLIVASISAAIGLAVSSTVGAYEAERVESKLDQRTIERAMLSKISEEHRDAFRFAAFLSAFVHGIAPLIAAVLPLVPFMLLPIREATVASIVVTMVFLFGIGAYLGRLVRERFFYTGLRFVAAGLATALLLWLLGPAAL